MIDALHILLLFITGAAGGFLSGLLGVGGGIVFVPVIDYLYSKQGFNGHMLVGMILANSLATIVFTGAVGSIKQFRMGNYFPRETAITAAGGIITSLALSYYISTHTFYSKSMFNALFAALLILLLIRMWQQKPVGEKTETRLLKRSGIMYLSVGALAGCVSALSGLGGGIIMVPVFHQWLRLGFKTATSISTGVITFLVFPTVVYYALLPVPETIKPDMLVIGWLNGKIIIPLSIGSLLFATKGVTAAHKLPEKKIRMIFLIFSTAVLLKTMREIIM